MTYSTQTKYEITIPKLAFAVDYHTFNTMEYTLKSLIHPSILVNEIGYSPSKIGYYAVLNSSLNAVNDDEIRDLLKEAGVLDLIGKYNLEGETE
jgi:hypothetical protein